MSVEKYIDRPHAVKDPLGQVLALVSARGDLTSTLIGHGDWALRFSAPVGAKFNSVTVGSCIVYTEGLAQPVTLRVGDSFLLTRPQEFVLATSAEAREQPASPFFRAAEGRTVEFGPTEQPVSAALIGGSFTFDRRARELLLNALPPLIYLPADASGAATAQYLLRRIDQEGRYGGLAADVIVQHLAVVLLVDMIRYHVTKNSNGIGWLQGLTDPVVAAALAAIHTAPAARWTVQLLADEAHVSRSTFAARFKSVVGQGPLEYLTRWRLEVGAHRLATTSLTIATIAGDVGYGSEAAFALAFKRELGMAPGRYRRSLQTSGTTLVL